MKQNFVKMSSTWGQSAWISMTKNPSETKRSAFYSVFTKTTSTTTFAKWLVGVVDGDGTFHFAKTRKNVWTFYFKVGQSNYNLRLLYFCKKILGVGSVSVPNSKDKTAEYRIRDRQTIINVILPIFDKYTLLTSKQFHYQLFRKAILLYSDSTLSIEDKNKQLTILKSQVIPTNFISSAWDSLHFPMTVDQVKNIISKDWLVGFTEAEGSFYLLKKGPKRIVHMFEITQKLDKILLDAISLLLPMKVYEKKTYVTCVTTNHKSIGEIIHYFQNTMKGMKSLEYRIWSRSYSKDLSYEELEKIRKQMRIIRSIRSKKENESIVQSLHENVRRYSTADLLIMLSTTI